MNQAMLILLLSVLSGGTGNPHRKGAGMSPIGKSGLGAIKPVTTRHMIRQMHEAIDALQRVEQISRLADFSTIRKKEEEGYRQGGGHHDHKDGYIGNIREAFGNIGDLLAGGDHDGKKDGMEEIHKQGGDVEEESEHDSSYADAAATDDVASGTGMNPDVLISLIGNLIGNMNSNNDGNHRSDSVNRNRNENGNKNNGRSSNGNSFGNGLDIEKLMKMMSLISSLSNTNQR